MILQNIQNVLRKYFQRQDAPPVNPLAAEVPKWEDGTFVRKGGWIRCNVPRHSETEAVDLRLPKTMLTLIEAIAKREGISPQLLMKNWMTTGIETWKVSHANANEKPPPQPPPQADT